MAVGEQAEAAGYPLVADENLVRDGAMEINRTRDFVAELGSRVPLSKAGFRTAAGISSGTADPTGGNDGDIYFKIIG